ncbi:PREDICTED: gastrin/cholecystokinin type B receptor-like [Acropora digitifera]|uniref:gastrin/cholecystokinin type B receptor-like n=1 Tax=Acropora digitifera TaxID=70779 RepID=UPI00077B13E8|nr:PREDICTED: gastrin/cholecystokinin type B receptor-like [Acropora digitifera]
MLAQNESFENSTTIIAQDVLTMSPLMTVFLYCLYATVFSLALLGNTLSLITCYGSYKDTKCLLLCFIASLASADLLLTLLSIFNLIAFIGNDHWILGGLICKAHSFLIESCYTVSILTLVAISRERLRAVSSPLLARVEGSTERKVIPIVVWVIGILTCTPLLYAYHIVEDRETGKSKCLNTQMGNKGRQIYYSIQVGLLFLVPLVFMTWAHIRIFKLLSIHEKTRSSLVSGARQGFNQNKVTRMLAVVTVIFFVCYGPFMVIRELRYFYVYNGMAVWKLSQMMIFIQAAVNPIIYCFYSQQFRQTLKDFFCCCFKCAKKLQTSESSSEAATAQTKERSTGNTVRLN